MLLIFCSYVQHEPHPERVSHALRSCQSSSFKGFPCKRSTSGMDRRWKLSGRNHSTLHEKLRSLRSSILTSKYSSKYQNSGTPTHSSCSKNDICRWTQSRQLSLWGKSVLHFTTQHSLACGTQGCWDDYLTGIDGCKVRYRVQILHNCYKREMGHRGSPLLHLEGPSYSGVQPFKQSLAHCRIPEPPKARFFAASPT